MSARPARGALVVVGLWGLLVAIDLLLRLQIPNNASPTSWSLQDAGVYLLGALWSLASWYLLALGVGAALASRPRLRQATVISVAMSFGSVILLSFAYRLYYYQSPSWQVVKFVAAEPENTRRILLWNTHAAHVLGFAFFIALVGVLLSRATLWLAPPRAPRWAQGAVLAVYATNSALTLFTAGFQDPLPVEANSAAALAQFIVASTTRNRHLSAPVRPVIPPQPPRERPSLLLIIHESLRADAALPLPAYSEVALDARQLSPYSARLPERRAEGFFVLPRARANASATEASLPTILSGLDLGGATDAFGRVHTVWSLGKATGAKTWLFSAQTYAWSHFDEYFFDHNLDLYKTGLDLAPAYVNDVGVDDIIPVERALAHIDELHRKGERWVGVVHFSGSHVPGYPGPGIAPDPDENRRWRQAARYIDRAVERLLEGLLASPAAASTVIISTSDHGEPLESSRKIRRLGSYYEEVARVPFWVRLPPAFAASRPDWASHLDAWSKRNVQNTQVLPTIRDALLIDPADEVDRFLFAPSLLRSPEGLPDLTSGQGTCAFRSWWQEGLYIVHDDRKLLLSNERASPELYDLTSDPRELRNLWGDPAERQRALRWATPHILAGQERTAACKRIGKNCILP